MKEVIKVSIKRAEEAIIGYTESALAKSEDNDCVVRALAAATEVTYNEAHSFVAEKFGRKPKKGTLNFNHTLDRLKKEGKVLGKTFTKIGDERSKYLPGEDYIQPATYYMNNGVLVKRQMTFKTFVKQYPKGTYLLTVRGHAFSVKDGVVVGGNYSDATQLRKRIESAYQIN